jgi:hypothetical protein
MGINGIAWVPAGRQSQSSAVRKEIFALLQGRYNSLAKNAAAGGGGPLFLFYSLSFLLCS